LTHSQNVPIKTDGTLYTGVASEFNPITYTFNPQQQTFELDVWRTQAFSRYTAPLLIASVSAPGSTPDYSFSGQKTYYPTRAGNYTVAIQSSSTSFTYQIRVCLFSCPVSCPYTILGYCDGNGACINGVCTCDNSTLLLDSSCSVGDTLWEKLIGIWIACIVIGFIVVVVIPIVICCCCCGMCAAAAAESKPIHHHHHHQHHQHQEYNSVPPGVVFPNAGQPYIQANAYQQPQGYPQQGYPPGYQQQTPGFYTQ
jgi:hypothetical protein